MTEQDPYWSFGLVTLRVSGLIATVELADPARRNALGVQMFDAFHAALRQAALVCEGGKSGSDDGGGRGGGRGNGGGRGESARVVVLRGAGPAFCGGFDLAACNENPALLRAFVERLSAAVQALRALPVPVVAQVQGAALAGGCALLAGCDFAVVALDAQLGYPVHRIGVSPAVTLPTLMASSGAGAARTVTMGGALYRGADALRAGLATCVADSADALPALVAQLCASLAAKGPHAMRTTKAWMNELDGTGPGVGKAPAALARQFAHTAQASAAAAEGDEFAGMLREFWAARAM